MRKIFGGILLKFKRKTWGQPICKFLYLPEERKERKENYTISVKLACLEMEAIHGADKKPQRKSLGGEPLDSEETQDV